MISKELKDKWVAALRSGDYKQGIGCLKYKDKEGTLRYCCLGVLAEVAGNKNLGTTLVSMYGDTVNEGNKKVYSWVNKLIPTEFTYNLISMNDAGAPFDEIADEIREWSEGGGHSRV